jgi:hypothetical protein
MIPISNDRLTYKKIGTQYGGVRLPRSTLNPETRNLKPQPITLLARRSLEGEGGNPEP